MTAKSRLTVAEFDAMVGLSENAERQLELVEGEVFEGVSNNYAPMVATRILGK